VPSLRSAYDRLIRTRTAIALLVVTIAALAPVPGWAAGEREIWQDDTGPSQGVSFTRDITHTHVPSFYDSRPASFSCDNGQGYDDPLVVIAAGDGSGNDLNVEIASDGSFSYSGQATWSKGTGTISFQGKFTGDTASGTVQWTAVRPNTDAGTCTGSAGPAQWTAHCAEQCGGSSSGAITVAINGRAVIGQFALVDVTVKSDGAGRIAAFVHHDGARSCGTFTTEDGAAARPHLHGAVERLGEGQVPGAGTFVLHGKYIPDQFGHADRICAYLTQAPAGDTVLAKGEGTPQVAFALPWNGIWDPLSRRTLKPGVYSIDTPEKLGTPARRSAPGFFIVGTWGCDGGLQRPGKLAGRRWWLGTSTFQKALKLTPVRTHADGSFSFSGAAHPDFSSNYDHPIPKKWPARTMHITISGRFRAGHDEDGAGVVKRASAKLTVVNGIHRCATTLKLAGGGAASDLPTATDRRYDGTVTAA
jgi:hypothetical protein